jgi:hypothetical protein
MFLYFLAIIFYQGPQYCETGDMNSFIGVEVVLPTSGMKVFRKEFLATSSLNISLKQESYVGFPYI